jgi:exoribonuclease R
MDGKGNSNDNGKGRPKGGQEKQRSRGRGGGRGGGRNSNNSNANTANTANTANNNRNDNRNSNRSNNNMNIVYPPYWKLEECVSLYNSKDPSVIRGTLRVLPNAKDAMAFCTCDRGSQKKDVLIEMPLHRNRALDGDVVYVELKPEYLDNEDNEDDDEDNKHVRKSQKHGMEDDVEQEQGCSGGGDEIIADVDSWWQDDPIQMSLWSPVVPIRRRQDALNKKEDDGKGDGTGVSKQRNGRVIHVVPPKSLASEIHPNKSSTNTAAAATPPTPYKNVVGILKRLQSGTVLLTTANKSLPQFKCSESALRENNDFKDSPEDAIFQAKYEYGSWKETHKWPPCTDVRQMGVACNVEDETKALLITNQLDHGEFPAPVLEECASVVESGEFTTTAADGTQTAGWKPTPEMYQGRRDYRHKRIFTIDPTTARDLDDALHIDDLGNGQVEIGVHIADVSHFIKPDSLLDAEAQRRCTTVYLVDRIVPMLPRPLCEIACSLNEDVERLAFSCVWRMNMDGNVAAGGGGSAEDVGAQQKDVWYGRTVIKSCGTSRLDCCYCYFCGYVLLERT